MSLLWLAESSSFFTEPSGKIDTFTMDELKDLSVNFRQKDKKIAPVSGQSEVYTVPSLSEVFNEFGENMNFIIELKDPEEYPGIEGKLIETLQEFKLIGFDENGNPRAVVHSFDEKGLKRIHESNQDIPILKLISFDKDKNEMAKLSTEEVDELKEYADGLGSSYESLTKKFVNKMQNEGLAVYAYTVNDRKTALKMKEMGTNGIHTNRPDIMEKNNIS